jgi:protein-S-isoprenylcysteine O-methyltransferase Ste14
MEHLQPLTFFNILFYVANFFWLFEFILFRNKNKKGRFQEKQSFLFLVGVIILTIGISIELNRRTIGLMVDTPYYFWMQILGLIFYGVGLYLRYRGSIILGLSFTRHVAVNAKLPLAEKGPYQKLRHPLYLGLFLLSIAFPLYIGNIIAFLIFSPLLFFSLRQRMIIEEKAMSRLHPDYEKWKQSRYRFIPLIY